MKKYLLAMVLMSVSAMACPNLTGTFVCLNDDGSGNMVEEEVTMAQSTENGVTVYTAGDGSEKVIADGKTRVDADGVSQTATCVSDKSLNLKLEANQQGFTMLADLNISADANGLHQNGTVITSFQGQTQKEEVNQTCKRK